MGVKAVTLADREPAAWEDLSAQFFLTPDDVAARTPRDVASAPRLAALNSYVRIDVLSEDARAPGGLAPSVLAR
jgi:ubiquitin-activating enzyme E1